MGFFYNMIEIEFQYQKGVKTRKNKKLYPPRQTLKIVGLYKECKKSQA